MEISKIPSAGFQDNVKFRNIIINGDMSIAQRGTSATGLGNADNGYHTCDRWKFQEIGSPTGVFTQSQSTDVPSGQGFATSLKMDCTTADTSLASDDWLKIEHKIEGQNIQYLKYGTSSAQSLTLSFWVKSSKTGTYGVGLFQTGDNRHNESNYTINSANTWEKKTITYSGDTNTTPDNDNTEELRLWFTLLAGTGVSGGTQPTSWSSYNVLNVAPTNQVNLSDSTSNEWYITGIQLEAGTTASDFEFLPVDVNLKRCERYYETLTTGAQQNFGTGLYYNNGKIFHCPRYRTTKRAVPSLDQVTGTNIYSFFRNNTADNFNGFDQLSNRTTETCAELDCDTNVSGTAGQAGFFRTGTSATTAFVAFDAEL
jgi:hypothetical protein